jgi:predicted DNA-binding transcriptional regulator AlpA
MIKRKQQTPAADVPVVELAADAAGDAERQRGLRLLNRAEVVTRVKLSYPTIWAQMQAGKFPRSRMTSHDRVCWLENEIDDWIENLPIRPLKGEREEA